MTEAEVLHPLRPILKNWVWEHGRVGTRYLDCSSGVIGFDDGKKSRYATGSVYYVPLGSSADVTAAEVGPAIHDGALARFLRAAQLGKPEEAGSVTDVQRAAQDCVELGLACAYQNDAQRAHKRYALEPMFEDEIRAAVVVDIRTKYVGLRAQLALYDFTVLYGLPTPLLINEAPFIDWRVHAQPVQPFVTLPLSPYSLLVGTPSGKKSRAGPVLWKSASVMGPFKDHNRYIVEHARRWIVATTDDQLVAVQDRFAAHDADGKEIAKP
jgi:hypothetical protein